MREQEFYTVKDVAKLMSKNEETIKRWLRDEKRKKELFPHAYKKSDKEGWKIPEVDIQPLLNNTEYEKEDSPESDIAQEINYVNEKELIRLAYKAVTLTEPPELLVNALTLLGIKRTLECLLIMRQSPKPVKNPVGFIKAAIREGWTHETVAPNIPDRKSNRLVELTQKDVVIKKEPSKELPFYNWLED